jgi:hypothetical protein
MHIRRMGIRWCKQAINLNALVYLLCKGGKFGPVHFFAVIFVKPPSGARHLGRA